MTVTSQNRESPVSFRAGTPPIAQGATGNCGSKPVSSRVGAVSSLVTSRTSLRSAATVRGRALARCRPLGAVLVECTIRGTAMTDHVVASDQRHGLKSRRSRVGRSGSSSTVDSTVCWTARNRAAWESVVASRAAVRRCQAGR
jgi:hypothetical protein